MIDPYTGEDTSAVAHNLSAAMAMGGMERAGLSEEEVPFFYDLLESIPTATSTAAINMGRVSNTIIGGGKHVGGTAKAGGLFRRGIGQTFNPRYASRLGSAAYIDPAQGSKTYSPFGAVARSGNFAARHIARTSQGKKLIEKMGGSTDSTVSNFSRGTFGRMTALARIASMSDDKVMSSFGQVAASTNMMRPGAMASTAVGTRSAAQAKGAMIGGIGNTIDGRISGRVAGYFIGTQLSRTGGYAEMAHASRGTSQFFGEALQKGFTSNSMMAKAVGSRGAALGLRAAPGAGWVLLAHDLGSLAGKTVAHTGRTMIDAGVEMMAPLNKGVMGGTFKDNAVAATARQRAVGAISGSRLNAMSVLGNEAAGMHARYG